MIVDWIWIDGLGPLPIIGQEQVCYDVIDVSGSVPPDGGGGVPPGGGGDPGGGGYPPPGGGGPPLNPPTMSVDYVTDANPHWLLMGITYSSNTQYLRLRKNGQVIDTIAPTTQVSFGDLNNYSESFYQLTVEACNADGCAEGGTNMYRTPSRDQAAGSMLVLYYVPMVDENGTPYAAPKNAVFTHDLRGDATVTSYSIATSGDRNGRVLHTGSTEQLLWNDQLQPPPAWGGFYYIYPWWGGVQPYEEDPCSVGSPFFPFSSGNCGYLLDYASPSNSSSYGRVEDISIGLPGFPNPIIGDRQISLWGY